MKRNNDRYSNREERQQDRTGQDRKDRMGYEMIVKKVILPPSSED